MPGGDGGPTGLDGIELLLLDVNETLSDLAPLGDTFVALGLAREHAQTWFARVLRDGFALTTTGATARFADLGETLAAELLTAAGADPDRAGEVVEAFTRLDVHPDVRTGLPALREAGVRVVTLSNGSTGVAESLLERAGLSSYVDWVLSVEDAGSWKPAAAAYRYGVEVAGGAPERTALVAVHPWDVHGALVAGLRGVLVTRGDTVPAPHFREPTLVVDSFDDLAARLGP